MPAGQFPPRRAMTIMEIWTPTISNSLPGSCFAANFPSSSSSAGSDRLTIADVGEAQIDLDRHRRCGFPEVVFAEGKTVAAMEKIFQAQIAHGSDVLATRMAPEQAAELAGEVPRRPATTPWAGRFASPSATATAADGRRPTPTGPGGDRHRRHQRSARGRRGPGDGPLDRGRGRNGAGRGRGRAASADGQLAAVGSRPTPSWSSPAWKGRCPAWWADTCPVRSIAVPTSVGYGASFGGIAALLGMLNSCAANVSVVNIDAGFKGGYVAGLIARMRPGDERPHSPPIRHDYIPRRTAASIAAAARGRP